MGTLMGTLYVDTAGSALNSGSSDSNTADLSGALAVQAANIITLDGSPNLSGVSVAGATQAAINIQGATNANRTVFWITAVDNTLKTVTVDATVTGTLAGWKIGGRYLWPSGAGVNVVEGALGLGEASAPDVLQFNNTPATKTVAYLTKRVSGSVTKGRVRVIGKSGTRPLLNVTNTASVIVGTGFTGWEFNNLEFAQNGGSGNAITINTNDLLYNVKISDTGSNGVQAQTSAGAIVMFCEITGCGVDGINCSVSGLLVFGNYIHDNVGNGITFSPGNPQGTISWNIIDTNAGRGILISGPSTTQTSHLAINNNTVYGNGDSGLEVSDADTVISMFNNIFQDNGNAAGEYNVEWVAGTAEYVGTHGYNCFYLSSGSNNVSGLTTNATEITTDPLFTNPGTGDFTLGLTSPAKAAAVPGTFLGGSIGYLDMGAVQRQEPSGAGLMVHPGMLGGMRG